MHVEGTNACLHMHMHTPSCMPCLTYDCSYSVARQMRQWEEEQGKSRVPIIALTAHTLDNVTER